MGDESEKVSDEVVPLLIELQSQLSQETSLSSLSRQYGYSPFHFHRFFVGAVGETPKEHVDRLRLERAAYKLAITDDSVLEIALSVGFKHHETFTRAFKRAFNYSPRAYRQACRLAQAERLDRNRGFRGEGCRLSDVRFVSLPPCTFLAIRRYGRYADCPVPFQDQDDHWSDIVAWARANGVPYLPLAFAISYDDPTVTPPALQRLDACIPISGPAAGDGRIRRLDFRGGYFGGIEHAGPLSTIDQAYRGVADGIRRSHKYVFDVGPPVQIYRKVHIGGDSSSNLTEVYFPTKRVLKDRTQPD